jgi:ATP-dependent Zn protease
VHPIVDDGWIPMRLPQERRTAIHEAGHAIAAIVAGRFVHEASIIPHGLMSGHVFWSESAARCSQVIEEKVETDYSKAVRLASLFAPLDVCPRWKAILHAVRTIRQRAEEIIEENWVEVLAIAGALEKHKRLDRPQIEALAVNTRIGVRFPRGVS